MTLQGLGEEDAHQSCEQICCEQIEVSLMICILGAEKLQKESSPHSVWILSPSFAPKVLRNFPDMFENFSCFVSWESETTEILPNIPATFQCQTSRQIIRNIIHKVLWRALKVM